MDTQLTTEAIKEITERYELYKDIVKIGLGALIGASASLITVLLKNKHELKKIDNQHNNESNKHKLEIKVKILEEVIELANDFTSESYNFYNQLYKIKYLNKYFKDLEQGQREKLFKNNEAYTNSIRGVHNAKRKLEMIGATSVSTRLEELKNYDINFRNEIGNNSIKIDFTEESWEIFRDERYKKVADFNKELNNFFLELR